MWPDLKFLESSSWRYEEVTRIMVKMGFYIIIISQKEPCDQI